MTRGPAKPILAPGSATITSDSVANDAATPPKVGSVTRVTVSSPASSSAAMALLVLAICISDSAPSCIRAPPDAVTSSSGSRCASAVSAAVATASPAAQPRLPPRNRKSMAATTTGWPRTLPRTTRTASSRPVARRACASRCRYGTRSVNSSGSCTAGAGSTRSAEPGSSSRSSRSAAVSLVCRPHS
ncbi:hypothetical protein GTS_26600 [Gandjariella thermophila]|uniref:Uncharacterized protein n=1 Tax=Gandjariella thermophila TaxID=1931992 RepID=A0A4D4JAP7_9PSEU|nr:hypothetical protein GTS_26600 [Gandjariella thermophila]